MSEMDKSKKIEKFEHRRNIALFSFSYLHWNRMSQESHNPDLPENSEILSIKCHEGTEGEYGCTFSLTSALARGWVVKATGKSPRAHGMERWAGMDGCGKCRPHQGLKPKTAQSVASGYTDWAIPAHQALLKATTKIVPNKHPNKAVYYIPVCVCVSCNRVLKHAEPLRDFRLRSHCSGNLRSL
jgi:hypothetical protein